MSRLLRWSPVLLAVAVMIPRLWWASFGLLDDGIQLEWAPRVLHNPYVAFTMMVRQGRSLPVKEFWWSLVWVLGGSSPLTWYLVHTLLLAVTAWLFSRTLQRFGFSPRHAVAATGILLLSPPIIESFYTLSKSEPLLVAGLAAYLAVLSSRPSHWLGNAILVLVPAAAVLTKETSVALLPITLVWALWGRGRWRFVAILAWAGVAMALMVRYRAIGLAPAQGTYASSYGISLSRAAEFGLLVWAWIWRDAPWVFPASWLLWKGWRYIPAERRPLVGGSLVWSACWVGVFIAWPALISYYLAPAMLGLIIPATIAASMAWEHREEFRVSLPALLLLAAVGVANGAAFGVQQVTQDRANASLMEWLLRLPAGKNVWFDVPEAYEYVEEAKLQLRLAGRSDLRLDYWRLQPVTQDTVLVSAWIDHQSEPAPRGPHAPSVRAWRTTLPTLLPLGASQVFETTMKGPYLALAGNKVACWSAKWLVRSPSCPLEPPLLEVGPHTASWSAWRLPPGPQTVASPAVFQADGTWVLRDPGAGLSTVRFGQAGDRPLVADWNGDGWDDLIVFRPSTLSWLVDQDQDGRPDASIQVAGMQPGDQPLAGDWDGDGKADPGYFRPAEHLWRLFNHAGSEVLLEINGFGRTGDIALAGDWGGSGYWSIGLLPQGESRVILRIYPGDRWNEVGFGATPGLPVPARWLPSRATFMAFADGDRWTLRAGNGAVPASNPPRPFATKLPPGVPLAGRWKIAQ